MKMLKQSLVIVLLSCPTPSFSRRRNGKIQHRPNQVMIFALLERVSSEAVPIHFIKEAHRRMRQGVSAALAWSVISSVLNSGD